MAILQRARATMRDSPVKLADLALPSLGALSSVAISEQHSWGGKQTRLWLRRTVLLDEE
jgi:hypothetical protein